MYQRLPEVLALAKLRTDREWGAGTWDSCVDIVFRARRAPQSMTNCVTKHSIKQKKTSPMLRLFYGILGENRISMDHSSTRDNRASRA